MSVMSKKRKLVIIGVVIAIVALGAVFEIASKLNKPAQGTISVSNSAQSAQTAIDLTPTPGGGRYASFSYPAALHQVANSQIVTPVVAIYDFSHSDVESWNLAIEILQIPSGRLADNTSYQLRKIKSQQYQESHVVINNQTIDIMTDKTVGGFSQVAFLVHGPYQATVSLYGDDSSGVGSLQSTFNMVLQTWHWLAN